MRATRIRRERLIPRTRWPHRHTGFMTPLPPRRERRHVSLETRGERDTWWGREVHPDVAGPLRQIAVLVLWLLAVIAMILLLAEFWR